MEDFIIKFLKFVGLLAVILTLAVLFAITGWFGLIVGICIVGGATAIFSND